ncbi:Protein DETOXIFICATION [Rhynchospora pubera]|uniref:Protein DETOXIFICATION n=1 Tax=Rhynchospora pubera TaxID=906938 RepID=A0AAV8DJX9_9POAL|nr:Protein DETOXIFICATION [Rhynchospora pubera]
MCNTTPSSSPYLFPFKESQLLDPEKHIDPPDPSLDPLHDLRRWPSLSEVVEEMAAIGKISGPTTLTGLVMYSRSMVSMLFLGQLGELELAGGCLAIGFANITGYSVLSGLALGMEPICGQAYGARQRRLLGLALHRTVLLLLCAAGPISLLWLNMRQLLLLLGQDKSISAAANTFILYSLPDLAILSFVHPIRIYLRSQGVTLPVTYCSLLSVLLHVPLNYLLVAKFQMGIAGVALAMILTNFNLLLALVFFIFFSGVYRDTWVPPSIDSLKEWSALVKLAVPTCVSVCLEWWWYEIMIMLCGLLSNPKATVSSMGILIQTTSLVYVFPSSLSLGVSTRVGNELGAGRPGRARHATIVSFFLASILALLAMIFTISVRNHWGRLFTNDNEILKLTAAALPIAGICELGNFPQTTGCGVLRGSARPTVGANINLGSFYLVGMPVAVLLGFPAKMGFTGLWFGLLAAQATCATLMGYAVAMTDWLAEVERAKELTKDPNTNGNGNGNTESKCNKGIVKICGLEKEVICKHGEEKDPLIVSVQV